MFDPCGLRALCEPYASQSVKPVAILVERAAEVEASLITIVVTHAKRDFVKGSRGRLLADHIDDAAGTGLSVQHRRWPAEHFHALVEIRIDHVVGRAVVLQAIQKDARCKSAQLQTVGAPEVGSGTLAFRHYTRGIAQRFVEALRLLIVELLSGDYRDGLRCFDDRRIGLRRRATIDGDVSLAALCGHFDLRKCFRMRAGGGLCVGQGGVTIRLWRAIACVAG